MPRHKIIRGSKVDGARLLPFAQHKMNLLVKWLRESDRSHFSKTIWGDDGSRIRLEVSGQNEWITIDVEGGNLIGFDQYWPIGESATGSGSEFSGGNRRFYSVRGARSENGVVTRASPTNQEGGVYNWTNYEDFMISWNPDIDHLSRPEWVRRQGDAFRTQSTNPFTWGMATLHANLAGMASPAMARGYFNAITKDIFIHRLRTSKTTKKTLDNKHIGACIAKDAENTPFIISAEVTRTIHADGNTNWVRDLEGTRLRYADLIQAITFKYYPLGEDSTGTEILSIDLPQYESETVEILGEEEELRYFPAISGYIPFSPDGLRARVLIAYNLVRESNIRFGWREMEYIDVDISASTSSFSATESRSGRQKRMEFSGGSDTFSYNTLFNWDRKGRLVELRKDPSDRQVYFERDDGKRMLAMPVKTDDFEGQQMEGIHVFADCRVQLCMGSWQSGNLGGAVELRYRGDQTYLYGGTSYFTGGTSTGGIRQFDGSSGATFPSTVIPVKKWAVVSAISPVSASPTGSIGDSEITIAVANMMYRVQWPDDDDAADDPGFKGLSSVFNTEADFELRIVATGEYFFPTPDLSNPIEDVRLFKAPLLYIGGSNS